MKKNIEFIKDLWKDSRGRAILFFGFYFIFFFILIMAIRQGHHTSNLDSVYEEGRKYSFSFQEILNRNYSFSYSEILDGNTLLFEGKKNQNKMMFEFMGNSYYSIDNHYYMKQDSWEKSDNPFLLVELLDDEKIASLVEASSYESTTNYESGREVYRFLLSSNTIQDIVYGIHSDIMEEPNIVVVSVDENHKIDTITFHLNSYCNYTKICEKSLDIKLSYSDFGKIEKIESPIS